MMPSVNRDDSPSPFTVWVTSTYVVCLISQAGLQSTLFSRERTCLYCSWFWAGSFQPSVIKFHALWGIFIDALYQVEEISFCYSSLSVLIRSRCWILPIVSVGWSVILYTKWLQVWFLFSVHTWVCDIVIRVTSVYVPNPTTVSLVSEVISITDW